MRCLNKLRSFSFDDRRIIPNTSGWQRNHPSQPTVVTYSDVSARRFPFWRLKINKWQRLNHLPDAPAISNVIWLMIRSNGKRNIYIYINECIRKGKQKKKERKKNPQSLTRVRIPAPSAAAATPATSLAQPGRMEEAPDLKDDFHRIA